MYSHIHNKIQGNCLTANNLCKATLSSSKPGYGTKIYLGICEPPFKSRFNSHNATFKNMKCETSTKLAAGELWKIKEQNEQYNIKWSISLDIILYQKDVCYAQMKSYT